MLAHALPKQKRRSWRPGAGDWEGGRSREATVLPQRHGDRAGPCTSSRISAAGRSGRRAPRARLPACLRGEGICVVNYVARRRRFLARLCGKRRGGANVPRAHVVGACVMPTCPHGRWLMWASDRAGAPAPCHLRTREPPSDRTEWRGNLVGYVGSSCATCRGARENREFKIQLRIIKNVENRRFLFSRPTGSTPTPLTVRAKRVATARPRRSCPLRTASRRRNHTN